MDFSHPLEETPTFIPRNFAWKSDANNVYYKSKYAYIGAGGELNSLYFVTDGVNEHGLSAAELYLPGEECYQEEVVEGKLNLAPHEFLMWILGNCKSIEEVEELAPTVNLISIRVPEMGIITPLHWIISDTTGRCVVIEPTEPTLHVMENPVGTMTNTPRLEWHIENLRNYLHVRPEQYESRNYGDYRANPFSQGTGTSGLPGGYTPPERFIRATFFKENIEPAKDESEGISNAYHILNTVRIPKGIVVTGVGAKDYSLYIGSMCNESRTYYYSSYENHEIVKLILSDELLKETEPIVFKYNQKKESFRELNQEINCESSNM
jgi:choloylglycine hydrolase